MECADVNYCEKCFNKFRKNHIHNFQKIKRIMIVNNVVIPQKVLNPKIVQSKPILMGNITENYICNNNLSHPKIR